MFLSRIGFAAFAVLALPQVHAAALPACDANNGGLKLPPGFCALVVADNVGTARHMAVAPNGDLYVALQGKGGVAALHDSKGNGHFDVKARADGVAEAPDGSLYIADSQKGKIWRVIYRGGK